MANTGRITTGTLPRLLQYGLDAILKHTDRVYLGESSKIFDMVSTNGKGFYEFVQQAGMGPAGVKGEGDVALYDSVNQDFGYHQPLVTYAKSARVTFEAIDDNLYENLVQIVAKELIKSINVNDDMQAVFILNNATNGSVLWGDGQALGSSAHPLQAGGTTSNIVSANLSEDALESAIIVCDNIYNPDGILGDYDPKNLVVPTALRFVAKRITGSPYRTSTTDNDINATYQEGCVKDTVVWKRLSSNTAWFLTTDSDKGLSMADKDGIVTRTYKEEKTEDTIAYARTRRLWLVEDFRRMICSFGV